MYESKHQIIFFSDQTHFREWLEMNHLKSKEILVGFYKVKSGKPSMTWSESVDQALCFGWIDGIRKSIDPESYCIRFTPRRPGSNWSEVNIKKMEFLQLAGLMRPEGLKAFSYKQEDKSGIYSFESKNSDLSPDLEQKFKSNQSAWVFFSLQAPSYRKAVIHWVMTAKQEKTRESRLLKLIQKCEDNERL